MTDRTNIGTLITQDASLRMCKEISNNTNYCKNIPNNLRIKKLSLAKNHQLHLGESRFDNLSIGIQLFNRTKYLPFMLEYITSHFPGAEIVIVDAGAPKFQIENKKTIDQICARNFGIDIIYQTVDNDINTISHARIMVENANREFYIRWDDDDFYNPIAVFDGIEFLAQNNWASCVFGPSIQFYESEDFYEFVPFSHLPLTNRFSYQNMQMSALFSQHLWAYLVRTDVAIRAMNNIEFLGQFGIDQLWDFAYSMELLTMGCAAHVKHLFYANRRGNRLSNTSMGKTVLAEFMKEGNSDIFLKYRDSLSTALNENTFDLISKARGDETAPILENLKAIDAANRVFEFFLYGGNGADPLMRTVYRDFLLQHLHVRNATHMCINDGPNRDFIAVALTGNHDTTKSGS